MTRFTLDETTNIVRALFSGRCDLVGEAYFFHCYRVWNLLKNAPLDDQHAALLHDVVEETPVTLNDLRDCGYSDRVIWLVDRLTRKSKEGSCLDYIRGLVATGDHGLIRIKLADNIDNGSPARLERLPASKRSLINRYRDARWLLLEGLASARPIWP